MNQPPNDIAWVEAGMVEPGQRQLGLNPSVSEIATVADAGGLRVVVSYTDGSSHAWDRHEPLPIIADEPNESAR